MQGHCSVPTYPNLHKTRRIINTLNSALYLSDSQYQLSLVRLISTHRD